MLRALPILAGMLGLLAGCFAQSQETPRFRTGSSLIEFPLVALDSKGKPVTDLKREELSIRENGQDREVADLRFDGALDPGVPKKLAPGLFTNRIEYASGPPKNIVAIVMDSLNTPADDQAAVREQTLNFLTGIAPETRVAVYQLGDRLTVLHDFTAVLQSLRDRLSKAGTGRARTAYSDAQFADLLRGPGADSESRANARAGMKALATAGVDQDRDRRLDQTLAQLEALGNQLAAVPGRKSLIWIGAGVPILAFSASTPTDPRGWLQVSDPLFRRTAQRLATQGIAVYPVDTNGLVPVRLSGRAGPADPRPRIEANRRAATMELMAEVTGGRVTRNTNDPTEGVKLASADVQGAYTAAFYSPGEPDGLWHEVSIQVRRKGVKLTHRQGYLSRETATAADWTAQQWASAIASPVGSTTLRLDAWCELVRTADGIFLQARMQVPNEDLRFVPGDGGRHAEVDFVVAEKTADGEYNTQKRHATIRYADEPARDIMAEATQYIGRWKLMPNTSTLRLMAHDPLTGRYGTIDVAVSGIPAPGEVREGTAAAPPTPATSGDPFIDRARKAALEFLDTLPNYVVKQLTSREVQARSNRNWTVQDRIAAEVVYQAGKETTRDVTLNGKPASARDVETTGTWSTGQFGGMLNALFAPESAAVFKERRGLAKVAGREARVYDFSVKRANSMWELSSASRKYIAGYEGTVWLDRETARTLRFQVRARDLPEDFTLDQAESSTDYGFVRIGSEQYLVPTRSIALACSRTGGPATMPLRGPMMPARYCGRNVIQFQGYKQFGTESSISFDGK